MLILRAGAVEAQLTPDEGGGLSSLRFLGVDVLRPAPIARAGPESLSCFPLVPFANRIDRGRLTWAGRSLRLTPRFGDATHPLHGHGWLSPWRVGQVGPDAATLEFEFEPDDWPWRYMARQTIRLDERGATIDLELKNTGGQVMPAGLGFHPYFPDRDGARLTARFSGVWLTNGDNIPVRKAPPDCFADWVAGAHFPPDTLIDHCHSGWTGGALVEWPARGLTVRLTVSPNLSRMHIYAPPGHDYFCLEPVSHRPDAINAPDPAVGGVVALDPRDTLRISMRIAIATT